MNSAAKSPKPKSASVETQIAAFIDKFDPAVAAHIRACRAELRQLLPHAVEMVYDNYNFFVIGYGASERASEAILSIAAAANGVGLAFLHGATLPDPHALLQGGGKQNRFIRLPTLEPLRNPAVLALIEAAVAQSATPFPKSGGVYTVIKSISAKQRPRRKPAKTAKSAAS